MLYKFHSRGVCISVEEYAGSLMNGHGPNSSAPPEGSDRGSRWPWFLAIACVLIVLIAIFLPRPNANSPASAGLANASTPTTGPNSPGERSARVPHFRSRGGPALTAEELVAGKVIQFARIRRETVRALARHFKVEVPAEVERFYDAAEAGRWDELTALFNSMKEHVHEEGSTEGLRKLWPAILETYGVAEQAHEWPAQKLLDYGQAVLGSLRPDMIYIGGTDPGRFIPTLLNETSDGERRIVLTQNAFADGTYLEYAEFLYRDRLATLTQDDSQRAFQDYITDAQKRLQHDQQFPNEPKQVRPGEDLKMADDRFQVSGQVAVMAITGKLLETLMQKNPDASFAMETSFPFESMYAAATTLGPIMELRVRDEQNALTRERAAQALDYWRTTAQQFASDPEAADSLNVRKTYSKMASEQAALFLDRKYPTEAEQGFQFAVEICPSSPEAVFRYVNLLMGQNRLGDAVPVAEAAVKAAPEYTQFGDLLEQLKKMKKN